MNAVRKQVKDLVKVELESANNKFPIFASDHEAYGVILEEYKEAKRELKHLKGLKKSLLMCIMNNDMDLQMSAGIDSCFAKAPTFREEMCMKIKERAVNLACEAIQVAAMAQKTIDSAEARKEKNE